MQRSIITLLILLFTVVSPAIADILFYDNMETDLNKNLYNTQGNFPQKSSEHVRAGSYSRKFHQTPDIWRSDMALIAGIHSGDYHFPFEKVFWIGYSFYLPSNNYLPDWAMGTLEFHIDPDPEEGGHDLITAQPFITYLQTSASQTYLETLITGDLDFISQCCWNGFEYYKSTKSPIKLNTWNDVVLKIKFSYNGNGINEMWINGQKVLSESGIINAHNDKQGHYLMLGAYSEKRSDYTVWIDELRIGDANSSYSEVSPLAPPPADADTNVLPPSLSIVTRSN